MRFFIYSTMCFCLLAGCNEVTLNSSSTNNQTSPLNEGDGRPDVEKIKLDTIYVSSFREIISHARNNTVLFVKEGAYELGDSTYNNNVQFNLGKGQFGLFTLKNIRLIGLGKCIFSSKLKGEIPFQFEQIDNLEIRNISFKHDIAIERSTLQNKVLHFGSCNSVKIIDCTFDKTFGVDFNKCSKIEVIGSIFKHGYSNVIEVINSKKIAIKGSSFLDNYNLYSIVTIVYDSDSLLIENCIFKNNSAFSLAEDDGERCYFSRSNTASNITISSCIFEENTNFIACNPR